MSQNLCSTRGRQGEGYVRLLGHAVLIRCVHEQCKEEVLRCRRLGDNAPRLLPYGEEVFNLLLPMEVAGKFMEVVGAS